MFKLYSSAIRSRLEVRAPYLEASGPIERLKATEAWKYYPSVITDDTGNIIDDNGLSNWRDAVPAGG